VDFTEIRTAPRIGINVDPVDRFTIGPFAVGTLLGLARMPWWGAVAFAVGWEIIEDPLKDWIPGIFPHASHDSFTNSAFDAIAMVSGWAVIQLLPPEPLSRWESSQQATGAAKEH